MLDLRAKIHSIEQFQRPYLYLCKFESSSPKLAAPIVLALHNRTAVIPSRENVAVQFHWEGRTFFFPGIESADTKHAEFTFALDQSGKVLQQLQLLKNLSGTTQSNYSSYHPLAGSGYGFTMTIHMVDTTTNYRTFVCNMNGCRLMSLGVIKLDYSSTSPFTTVTAHIYWDTFSYDVSSGDASSLLDPVPVGGSEFTGTAVFI